LGWVTRLVRDGQLSSFSSRGSGLAGTLGSRSRSRQVEIGWALGGLRRGEISPPGLGIHEDHFHGMAGSRALAEHSFWLSQGRFEGHPRVRWGWKW
jgi:hypothetical protein